MADIVQRLRARSNRTDIWSNEADYELHEQAADEIERLRSLIIEWADADEAAGPEAATATERQSDAVDALRKAVGR